MKSVTRLFQPIRLALFCARDNVLHKTTYLNSGYVKLNPSSIMAQRSITSFFTKTPKKVSEEDNNEVTSPKVKDEPVHEDSPKKSPKEDLTERRSSKRQRLDSSSSESLSPKKVTPQKISPVKEEKKKVKRQRIDSSSSEEAAKSRSPSPEKTIKVEKKSPKKYASPKTKKNKKDKIPLTEINGEVNSAKNTDEKKNSEDTKEKNITIKNEGEGDKPVAELYNPAKLKYCPVKDACWSVGAPVPYLALARTLQAIEETSSRLRIVDILSNYYRSVIALTPDDLLPSIYLCLNQLAPAHHGIELGIAESYLMKAIGACTGQKLSQVKSSVSRLGDLGLAAEAARSTQRTMFTPPPLTVGAVFKGLLDIARTTGTASVNKKIAKIQTMYVACKQSEARYLIRSLSGKLRVGLAEQSVLQALAQAHTYTFGGDLDRSRGLAADEFKARIEQTALEVKTAYCECPVLERLVPALLTAGSGELRVRCPLAPGVPLKPMLAQPTKGVQYVLDRFEGTEFTCEWKYDGERAQIHIPELEAGTPHWAGARVFSRNQEDSTHKFPDVLARLPQLVGGSVTSAILDCEAVAYDTVNKQILPFQVLSTRKRKESSASEVQVQVCVFVFDLLLLNGRPLVGQPLKERRGLLREHFKETPGQWQWASGVDCSSAEQVAQALEAAVHDCCEGLMVKTLLGPQAHYQIARRSHNWLKLKKDYLEGIGDTLDLVVIGAYHGRGKRAGKFGGFLLACYEPQQDEYQALCKIGTGFSDEDLASLTDRLQQHAVDQPKSYYRFDPSVSADVWVSPCVVVEVRCADLSLSPVHLAAIGLVDPQRGISLRFPRFIRVRDDKSCEQATSAQQIASMYLAQDQVKSQAPKPVQHDDFY